MEKDYTTYLFSNRDFKRSVRLFSLGYNVHFSQYANRLLPDDGWCPQCTQMCQRICNTTVKLPLKCIYKGYSYRGKKDSSLVHNARRMRTEMQQLRLLLPCPHHYKLDFIHFLLHNYLFFIIKA